MHYDEGRSHGQGQGQAQGQGQGHGHGHGNGASGHADEKDGADEGKLKMAVWFALFFMFVEIGGGIFANSLAIITDAAHMLSDVGGFIVSLVGLQLAAKGATQQYTYGYQQAEVLGALLSISIVWALTAILLWEAIPRFKHPEEIDGAVMLTISVIGFLVNLVLLKVLGHGHGHGDGDHGHAHGGDGDSVAVQAAIAHVVGDIVQSLGVCLAALLIWKGPEYYDIGVTADGVSKWNYADPCCTVLFSILVLFTTKSTLKQTIGSLMIKAPGNIDQQKLLERLSSIAYVDHVHDLHVWSLGSKEVYCTAHIMVHMPEENSKWWNRRRKNGQQCPCTQTVTDAREVAQEMGIGHSTFQVEIAGQFDPSTETGLHGVQTWSYTYGNDVRVQPPIRNNAVEQSRTAQAEQGHYHGGGHNH